MPYADKDVAREYHNRKSLEWKRENPEKVRESTRKYRKRNKDRQAAYMRIWRAKNKEKVRANFRKWADKNQDYYSKPDVKKRTAINAARSRAKKLGVPFSITVADLTWPDCCPVLGLTLDYTNRGRATDSSPSLDRTDPAKGYVPGNVVVMSHRANFLKRDGSVAELLALGEYAALLKAQHTSRRQAH